MNTETQQSNKKPGDSIDSWCGKCKLVLAHTIEAMHRDKPARVHCNTCKSQHTYKASRPGTASGSQPAKPRTSRYRALLKDNGANAKTYSSSERYALGDVMSHPSFGIGVTTAIKDGAKIEVLFEAGPKVLIHGK